MDTAARLLDTPWRTLAALAQVYGVTAHHHRPKEAERRPALLRPQATYSAWAALDPAEQTAFQDRARVVLRDLLIGPLHWFGVIGIANEQLGESVRGSSTHPTRSRWWIVSPWKGS